MKDGRLEPRRACTRKYADVMWLRQQAQWLIAAIAVIVCSVPQFMALPAYTLDIGTDRTNQRIALDQPFLGGFWPAEAPTGSAVGTPKYRWTRPEWEVLWPHFGRGYWVVKVSFKKPSDTSLAQRNFQLSNAGIHHITWDGEVRHIQALVSAEDTDTPVLRGQLNALTSAGDRRALGVIATQAVIQPAITPLVPRPWQLGALWCVIGLLLANVTGLPRWIAVIAVIGTSGILAVSQLHHPVWWALHSPAVVGAFALAGVAVLGYRLAGRGTPQPIPAPIWGIFVALAAVQLVWFWSPWLIASDIRMHIRLFGQATHGDLWLTAVLPCEAGGTVAPYPPLIYLGLAPLGLLFRETHQLIPAWYAAAVILHSAAIWYWGSILSSQATTRPLASVFVIVASLSTLWWNSVHIGEMTNAWGHALFMIAMGSWLDVRASTLQRGTWSIIAMLSHSGIALTYALSIAVLVIVLTLTTRHIAWRMVTIHMAIGVGIVVFFYSGYMALFNQAPAPAGCPPTFPILMRYAVIPTSYPLFGLAFLAVTLLRSRHHALFTWYAVGIGMALLSLAVLLVRDQTVRWGIAVTPFIALAVSQHWHWTRHYGVVARIMYASAILYTVWSFYTGAWQRIISYLH